MARQFNGSNQYLNSASALVLSGQSRLTIAFFMWNDNFTNDDKYALEIGPQAAAHNSVIVAPNSTAGGGGFLFGTTTGTLTAARQFTWPSSATWHHYVFDIDRTIAGSGAAAAAWVDQVSQSTGASFSDTMSGNFTDETGYVATYDGTGNYLAGRMAEVAIWGGINFSQTDVDNLFNSWAWNGGSPTGGTAATNVQSGNLLYYWQLCGDLSPEPATVGSVNMTVTNATKVAHPLTGTGICAPAVGPGLGIQELGWMAATSAWR